MKLCTTKTTNLVLTDSPLVQTTNKDDITKQTNTRRDRSNSIKGRIVTKKATCPQSLHSVAPTGNGTRDLLIANPTLNSFCVFRQRAARIMRRSLNTREHAIPTLFNREKIPPNCFLPWGHPDPHLIHGYLGAQHPTCQTASRSVQPFWWDTSSLHHRQTDTETQGPLHTSVAIDRIYAMHMMPPKNP